MFMPSRRFALSRAAISAPWSCLLVLGDSLVFRAAARRRRGPGRRRPKLLGGMARGSVSSANRGSANTSRSSSGNGSTRTTNYETRSGNTGTATRNVSKSGDEINVNRNVQSAAARARPRTRPTTWAATGASNRWKEHLGHRPQRPDRELGRQGRARKRRMGVRRRGPQPLRSEGRGRRVRRARTLRQRCGRGCRWRPLRRPHRGRGPRLRRPVYARNSRPAIAPTTITAIRTTATAAPTIGRTTTAAIPTTDTCGRPGACTTRPCRSAPSP